jgi:hypothetical protein
MSSYFMVRAQSRHSWFHDRAKLAKSLFAVDKALHGARPTPQFQRQTRPPRGRPRRNTLQHLDLGSSVL